MFGKESNYQTRQINQGEVLLREGELVENLLLVKSGEIACVTMNNDRVVPVYTLQESGVIGEEGIFSATKVTPYSAVALTNASVTEIPRNDIMKFVNESSDWVKNILFDISEKVSNTTELIAEHRIIDDRFNGGKSFTSEEEMIIKNSLSGKTEED